jgi:hypothetical protein
MTMRLTAVMTSVLLTAGLSGCKGGSTNKPAATSGVAAGAGAALSEGPDCSGLVTGAALRTPEVKNGAADSRLVFDVFVEDCSGMRQPLAGRRILFDVEAEIGELLTSPYTIRISDAGSAAGTTEFSGALQGVEGEDVFGRRGPEYFLHQTERLPAVPAADAVTFSIDLAGQNFYPVGGGNERHFRARTHLRVEGAAPVSSVVTFLD